MKADVRLAGEVIIVDLEGNLVAGVGDEVLTQVMNELVAKEYKKILLNLSGVSIIDSLGVGELVASVKLGQRFGSEVKMTNIKGQVREVLDLTQLLPVLGIHSTEAEALAAFADKPAS